MPQALPRQPEKWRPGRGLPQSHQKGHPDGLAAQSIVCVASEPWQARTIKECMFHGSFRNFSWFCVQEREQDPHGITPPTPIWLLKDICKAALGLWVAVRSYATSIHLLLQVPATKKKENSSVLAHVWPLSLTRGQGPLQLLPYRTQNLNW